MEGLRRSHSPLLRRVLATGLLAALPLGISGVAAAQPEPSPASSQGCQLDPTGPIRHVIYVQFDNVHFTRDNPNVPSDLEQMPHLLNFIEQNGTLLSNHHTPLIAHTATDIVTSLTGLYPDHHGMAVSNSYRFFNPNGTSASAGSFAYWTDGVGGGKATDTSYNLVTPTGANTPAPWVPYTRAGCDVGAVGTANMELENTSPDVAQVFGANSPEAAEVASKNPAAYGDFVGLALHCAANGPLCAPGNGGVPDRLPSEPDGYNGYNALFGNKYVAPAMSPAGPLTDINGQPIIDPDTGQPGFPGFDGMSAAVSLGYVAAMQEHGVPVTYAYISDAHDNHSGSGGTYGPGAAGYVAQLKAYDQAFGAFFARLAADGINQGNTLFVFTADEGDHFVGGAPTPAGCDGIHTACTYSQIGEVDANLTGLLATQENVRTPFAVHSDAAPVFYATYRPVPTSPVARTLERAVGALTAPDPLTGSTVSLTNYLADPTELGLLLMVTGDPARTPTFVMFANPDFYLYAGSTTCSSTSPCVAEEAGYAWNHGDVAPEINTTWLGLVGPGVQNLGVDGAVWSDHTDIRPTMMALLGLHDDYAHDGRVLFEVLADAAVPQSLRAHWETLTRLAQVYKQIDAPVGQLGLESLAISTTALESDSPGDVVYTELEGRLQGFATQRDALSARMSTMLEGAAFGGQPIDEQQAKDLIAQGQTLLAEVHALAVDYGR